MTRDEHDDQHDGDDEHADSSTAATTGQGPSNLPTTGGESNWAAMLLAFGVAALVLGGALTFARRSR